MAEDQGPQWTGPVRGFMGEIAAHTTVLLRKGEIPLPKPFLLKAELSSWDDE